MEQGAGVKEIGCSAERLFRRSRSAQMLCQRRCDLQALNNSRQTGRVADRQRIVGLPGVRRMSLVTIATLFSATIEYV